MTDMGSARSITSLHESKCTVDPTRAFGLSLRVADQILFEMQLLLVGRPESEDPVARLQGNILDMKATLSHARKERARTPTGRIFMPKDLKDCCDKVRTENVDIGTVQTLKRRYNPKTIIKQYYCLNDRFLRACLVKIHEAFQVALKEVWIEWDKIKNINEGDPACKQEPAAGSLQTGSVESSYLLPHGDNSWFDEKATTNLKAPSFINAGQDYSIQNPIIEDLFRDYHFSLRGEESANMQDCVGETDFRSLERSQISDTILSYLVNSQQEGYPAPFPALSMC